MKPFSSIGLAGCLVALLHSGCKKDAAATPEPSLEGTWRADSLHIASISNNVTGPTTTLLTSPATVLTISSTTFSDAASLSMGGTPTAPVVFTYTRSGNSITLSNSSGSSHTTGTIHVLTDHRLQLAFVRPVGVSTPTLQYQEVFYSR